MAERVDAFPVVTLRGRGNGYPWDEWMDGSVWKLVQGDDFGATITNFLSSAWKEASKRGHGCKTHRDPDGVTVYIQAVDRAVG
jgi:hypothetical protein